MDEEIPEVIFTEGDKISFDIHLNTIKYIVFEKITAAEENPVFEEMDILQEGLRLREGAEERNTRGLLPEDNEEYYNFLVDGIMNIMVVYYLQIRNAGYPEGRQFCTFETKYDLICHLYSVLCGLVPAEPRTRERIGRRRFQVHPLLRGRRIHGFFHATFPTLAEYDTKFLAYTRMSKKQFTFLLSAVGKKIEKSSIRRDTISPDSRLLLTLRFLATGESFHSLALSYLIGVSTTASIIKETSEVIWEELHSLYIRFPIDIEEEGRKWEDRHHLPHCIGAVDGKHIRIQKPPGSSSEFFNYKNFFSIILLAVCDAGDNFSFASIGAPGSNSDATVWNNSELGLALNRGDIEFPSNSPLPNSETNFGHFLIGDNGFPLSRYLFRYYGGRNITPEQQNFNNKVASARNSVERMFGIFSNRFQIFRGEICTSPEFATKIVQAAVVLHNFIRKTADHNTPKVGIDAADTIYSDHRSIPGRSNRQALQARDTYKDYLFSLI